MADFAKHHDSYRDEDVAVIAVSADSEADAETMRDRVDAPYPIGHGVDAAVFADLTGCFWDSDEGFIHACAFILAPDGTIASAVYSAGAIGRFRAQEALEQTKFHRGDDD